MASQPFTHDPSATAAFAAPVSIRTLLSMGLETSAVVAMAGAFGYELDLQTLTDDEKEQVRRQIHTCRLLQPLLLHGRYDRLTDAMADRCFTAWQLTAADRSLAVVSVVVVDPQANPRPVHLTLKHLDPDARYRESLTGHVYSGAALCRAGLTLPILAGDYPAVQITLEKLPDEGASS